MFQQPSSLEPRNGEGRSFWQWLRQLSERSTCERINFEYLVHNSASIACWYQMPSTQVRAWRPCLRVLRWRDEIGLQIGAMISRIQRNGAAMERACIR